ncbi:MAG: hypothetical protein QOE31_2224 [Solirubrobacteraceae bacterium]|nr:hypothetical protein [Solirubrobacteraceae bacterium]
MRLGGVNRRGRQSASVASSARSRRPSGKRRCVSSPRQTTLFVVVGQAPAYGARPSADAPTIGAPACDAAQPVNAGRTALAHFVNVIRSVLDFSVLPAANTICALTRWTPVLVGVRRAV